MKLEIPEKSLTTFKGVIGALKRMSDGSKESSVEEIKWLLKPDKIEISAMNESRTLGTIITIDKALFSVYKVEPNEEIIFKPKFLSKLINKNNDPITMELIDSKIHCQSNKTKLKLATFVDAEGLTMPRPKTIPEVLLNIDTVKIVNLMNDVNVLDDVEVVVMNFNGAELSIDASDDLKQHATSSLEPNKIIQGKYAEANYSYKFIKKCVVPEFDKHIIGLSSNSLFFSKVEENNVVIETFLAPRVDNY